MSNINKQELRRTSDRDWFEDWFKREFHPDKTGPYIKDQLFFAVLAARAPLLDELEAAEKLNSELSEKQRLIDICQGQGLEHRIAAEKRAEAAEKRIAEMEAREVKPVKGEVLVTVSGFTGCGKSAIAGEIEIAMKAIGVPVTWSNGDAEKRMTGADWLTAIEMYKPTVRIIEVNVPRAAAAGKGE